MRKSIKKFLNFFLLLFVISALPKPVIAAMKIHIQDMDPVKLVSTTNNEVTFEVRLSTDQINQKIVGIENNKFLELTIPGWSQSIWEGAPTLPIRVETIGVPFDAQFEVVVTPGKKTSLELSYPISQVGPQVIDWESWQFNGENSYPPAPQYQKIVDGSIYKSGQAFPGPLAEITADGIIRDQRVIGVSVYPLQYIPASHKLIVYKDLQVTIKFTGATSTQNRLSTPLNNSLNNLFQTKLLNYDTAVQWRKEPQSLLLDSGNMTLPWTPPDPGWRVLIQHEGFYRLGYDELQTAGMPVETLDPHTFQIFHQGKEIAVLVKGEEDGVFNMEDYIIFFGQGIESKYARKNVYWLTYDGVDKGLRIESKDAAPGTAEIPPSYVTNIRIEQNTNYISLAPGDENLERWLGDLIYARESKPQSVSYDFNLENLYLAPAKLKMQLLGFLRHSIIPDHHIKIYLQNALGNNYLGEIWWDGLSWQVIELTIDSEWLIEGQNTIIVECPNDTGLGVDVVYLDWLSLEYSSDFTAAGDQFSFSFQEPGMWKYQINGFTTADLMVFDVSNTTAVEQLTGVSITPNVIDYSLEFEDVVTLSKNYWMLSNEKFLSVVEIIWDTPSNLQNPTNGADHLIITHAAFTDQAETLSSFHQFRGLMSDSVDVQDIYDEFNFGIADPLAIYKFLGYTISHWESSPAYVVLFGDGHYDPKDYLGFGIESFIPPYLVPVDPYLGETAADNRYVTLVGDDNLPDMMLGRLAVNNTEEANTVVEKIIAYETSSPLGNWREKILTVTDNPDNAGNFYLISDNLLDCCLPKPFIAEKVYLKNTYMTDIDAREAIQSEINSGKLIVNYIGHATTSQWADEGILRLADIDYLINGDKMPILLPMTCMEGYYIDPGTTESGFYPSVAETITRVPNKGAIASWSPTGWGAVSGHDILNRGFFNALFQSGDGMMTLGMATQAGKIDLFSTGTNQDLMDTYLLFGDPATRIAFDFTAVYDNYEVEEDNSLDVSGGEPGKRGVLINDLHPQNSPLSAVLVENVTNGQLDFNSDGSFTYTPKPDYFGTDSFTYYASNGAEDSNIAVVEINISAVDEKIFLPVIEY